MSGRTKSKPQYRWVCPRCSKGKLGSSAPRRTSIVRYCLKCSKETGYLVERTCPALDRLREQKKQRQLAAQRRARQTKARAKQARERAKVRRAAKRKAAREEVAGDLHAELARIWPAALELTRRESMPRRIPKMTLRSRSDDFTSGRAWWRQHRIHLSVGLEDDVAGAHGTLAHEVCHLLTDEDAPSHGDQFWRLLVELVREVYSAKVTVAEVMGERTKYSRQAAIEASVRAARGYAE